MSTIVAISGQLGCGKDTAADRLVSKFGFVKIALADPIKRYGLQVFRFTEEQLWGPSRFRNDLDERFQHHSQWEADDAWEAAFSRASKFNKKYVEELFPESPFLRGDGFTALGRWMDDLADRHTRLSPRVMLQSLGTEWGRQIQSDLWIRHAVRTSQTLFGGGYVYDRAVGLIESEASDGPPGVVISDVRFSNELDNLKSNGSFLVRIIRPETDGSATSTGIVNHASELEQSQFTDDQFNYIISNSGTLSEFKEAVDVAGFILTNG